MYWYLYIIFYALSGGALSTYWDWLFGGKDNFYLHGLGCGLAAIPLFWAGIPWEAILIRTIICAVGMGLWSMWVDIDYKEEMGRGALFVL